MLVRRLLNVELTMGSPRGGSLREVMRLHSLGLYYAAVTSIARTIEWYKM